MGVFAQIEGEFDYEIVEEFFFALFVYDRIYGKAYRGAI